MDAQLAARKRLVWIALFIVVLFCLLVLQFFRIQVVEGEKWEKEALRQHRVVVTEPFRRGLFYSNTSLKKGHPEGEQPFVVDVPYYHLYIDPLSIPEPLRPQIIERLALLLHVSKEEKNKLSAQFAKRSHSRRVGSWLEKRAMQQIQHWWGGFAKQNKLARNAIYFVQDYKRSYPFGEMLGQVLHTLREDPGTKGTVPTGGLELYFHKLLKGKEGKRLLLRSPRHAMDLGDAEELITPPEDGADVYLTVNHYIQAIAEEEIEKAVKNASAKRGWAVMMHPRTGEILALAQYPRFNPARYRDFFNHKPQETQVKAITEPYEPGSTMKPLTIAICLKANAALKSQGKPPLFSPDEKVATSSGRFPGRSKPISDTHHTRFLNMNLALQKSSNIYMARMVQRIIEALGDEWYRSALQDLFGFGVKTGIELPGESIGLLPTPGKKHPNGALEWSTPTPFSLSFGHNILVTSVQMLRSYGIIANGGFDVKPTLIKKVVKTHPDGQKEVLLDNTLEERVKGFPRLLEPEIVTQLVTAMKYVTKPGGTASRGDIPGYTETGKTATSEKVINGVYSKKDHISTFIGFAPAKNAEFVLLIAIDDPEFKYVPGVGRNQMGGICAGPAFREIALRTLQYLGVPPDDPYGYPPGDPRRDPEKADWAKEIKQLRALYEQWNH